jgi:hypothetical protein
MLRVYGAFDPTMGDWVLALRIEDENRAQRSRGFVQEDGRVRYEPPTDANMKPTFRFSQDEAEALAKWFQTQGLTPKPADDLTPLKAHIADTIAVRDRLLTIVERKA